MLNALRTSVCRTSIICSSPLPSSLSRKGCSSIRIQQVVTGAGHPDNMQKSQETEKSSPRAKVGDTMSSFGEGYATRSDEEGFGGIYGGNAEDLAAEKAPEYDADQGCEVKEKERARNQSKVAA